VVGFSSVREYAQICFDMRMSGECARSARQGKREGTRRNREGECEAAGLGGFHPPPHPDPLHPPGMEWGWRGRTKEIAALKMRA
jgi:hypothetical protein